jgi:hypothetical protein
VPAPLIGLYSPAPASGKSTLASALWRHGFQTLKFASPLKRMTAALLREAGHAEPEIEAMLDGALKSAPIPLLGNRTPRHLMQTLGTEWGRTHITPTIWVDLLLARASALRASDVPVVIDDMRFPNEAAAIRAAGGLLIRINRPTATRPNGHASEGALDAWPFDLTITNDAPCPTAFATDATRLILELTR